MLRLYHVTSAECLGSILQEGLKPSRPRLANHRRLFKEIKIPKRVIYCWNHKNDRRTSKISKDVAYWHVWGWRLNDMLSDLLDKSRKAHDRAANDPNYANRPKPRMEPGTFVVLRFDVQGNHCAADHPAWNGYFRHLQGGDRLASPAYHSCDPCRQHDEPIVLLADAVPPEDLRPWAMVTAVPDWDGERWSVDVKLKRFR